MESYYLWIPSLLLLTIALKYIPSYLTETSTETQSKPLLQINDSKISINLEKSTIFNQFQRWYIIIFLLVQSADWMQGPYVYKLYSSYNIPTSQIAILFIIGFGTSGITGVFIGSLADKFGRKKMCILFCIFYTLCCWTKRYENYNILLMGRFLAGLSTSILYSCFEAWMITTHHSHGYSENQLCDTFDKAYRFNSLVAILSGMVTSYAVLYYERNDAITDGPYEIAAFDCSALMLIVACLMINLKWKQENYGDSESNLQKTLQNVIDLFKNDKRIILIGCIQSGFESAMYLFVFMWTIALEQCRLDKDIDHGMIFAVFMESCLVGTTFARILTKREWKNERISYFLCIIAAFVMLCVPFTHNYEMRLLMFVIFECCVGIYYPTIGGLRGQYVPDNVRATIMNIFRVPLNIIVVCALWHTDDLGLKKVFMLASLLLSAAAGASHFLNMYNTSLKERSSDEITTELIFGKEEPIERNM